ncbi:MAG: GAF domain-containing protein [Anaerolineales bacterium]|nr:GAF domain-containing protein [Anaerolineales bacterium]
MRQRINSSVRLRLTAIVLVAVLIPVIGIVGVVIFEGAKAYQERAQLTLFRQADVLRESTASWDETMVLALQNLSTQPDIIPMDPDQQEPALMNMAAVYTNMYLILTTDLDGTNVARSDGGAPNNYADRTWFQNAATGVPLTRQSLISRTTGKPVIGYSSPIQNDSGDVQGVAFVGTELTELADAVGASKIGTTGYGFLVDAYGNVLAHPDPALSADELVNLSDYPPVGRALAGQDGFFAFSDEDGVWYTHIETLDNGWAVIVQQRRAEALADLSSFLIVIGVLTLGLVTLITLLTWLATGRAVKPVMELTAVASLVAEGNLDETVPVNRNDEIGRLAAAFNSMTQQLRNLFGSLEQRVASRTRDLALAGDVGHDIAQIRDLDKLLTAAVDRIASRFDLYYVQIYLTDESGENLVLKAGTGLMGQELLAKEHHLPLNAYSINGLTAVQRQPVIVADTAESHIFQPNPALPHTRSEMAVPLLVGDQVLGVIDLQSSEPNALNQDNVPAFEALAGQLAVAIENARLLAEHQLAVESLQSSQQQSEAILNSITMPMLISRIQDGKIIMANQLLADLLHAPLDTLVGNQTPNFYQSVEDRQKVIGLIQEEGSVNNYELRLYRSDGELFWASLSAQLFTVENQPAIITILNDITERVETSVLLQERVKQLNILNEIGRMAEQTPPIPEFLGWVTERIPEAMKAPEFCKAAITYKGQVYGQPEATELPVQIVEGLRISGELMGRIYIAYTEKRAFENEESALIGGIGQRVSSYIETQTLIAQTAARARELQTVSDVGTAVASTLDAQKLLQDVVDLTKERFGLYHAHIYLLDTQNEELVLAAGAGTVGQQMKADHHKIRLNSARSLVARASRERQGVTVNDIHLEPDFMPNPLLPNTHSEMAVPMIAGNTLLGVLDLQSEIADRFDAEEILIFTTLASQIAVALQNARQYERAQEALEEVNFLQRTMTREGWQAYMTAVNRSTQGYLTEQNQLKPLQNTESFAANNPDEVEPFALPLEVRGTRIGRLGVRASKDTLSPEELTLIQSISQQVGEALERARLAEQTQIALSETEKRTQELGALNEMGQQLTGQATVLGVLQVIHAYTSQLMPSDEFYIAFYDQMNDEIEFAFAFSDGKVYRNYGRRRAGNGITEYVIRSREPLLMTDHVEERLAELGIEGVGREAKSWIGVPLVFGDKAIGAISLQSYTTSRAYNEQSLRMLVSIATQAAIAIENARLIEETVARARQEQLLREVSARVNAAVDAQSVLQTATREIGRALGLQTFIYLKSPKTEDDGRAASAENSTQAPANGNNNGHTKLETTTD